MKRNVILEIEETKQKLIYVINEALKEKNIPCYFIEPIIKDLYREISTGSAQEIKMLAEAELVEQQKQEDLKIEKEENNEN